MRFVISFLFLISIQCLCWARVDLHSTKILIIPEDKVTPKVTSADVAKIVPLDLRQGDDESTVLTRIADRSISMWFNSAAVKATTLGRIAETAQEKLKTDVIVPASSPKGVSHKFSFKVEALQALAKLEYTGWLKAAINYDAKTSNTDILLKDRIFSNKELIVSHKASKEQGLSMVGLAWSW